MTLRRKIISHSLLAAFTMSLLAGSSVRAEGPKDVLKLVPEDAWGFVVLRSLETLDQKAAQLKELLDLPIPPAVTPMLLSQLPVGDTLDLKRPVCVVTLDANKFGGDFESATAVLVPATDPKALIEKLGGEEPKDGVSKCIVQQEELYAAVKGKTVILGKSQECVSRIAKSTQNLGEGFDDARMSVLEQSDVYLSVSVRAVFGAYKNMVMPTLQMLMAATDPEGKTVKTLEKTFMEWAAMDIAVSIDKEGFALRFLIVPKDGSDLELLLKDTTNASKSLLSILPQEKYLLAFGGTGGYSEHAEKFSGPSMLSTLLQGAQMEGVNEKAVKTLDDEVLKLTKGVGPFAVCMSALPSGADGMFGLTLAMEPKDPKAFLESIRTVFKTVWTLSDDEEVDVIKESVVHAEDAKSIAGNKVDTITIKTNALADMFEIEEGDLETFQTVMGKDFVVRFGRVGDKHVVCTFGGGDKRYEAVCKAVTSSGGAPLSDDKGIEKISARLPSPRATEAYFAVDNILAVVKSVAKAVGEEDEAKFDVPVINAPLAFGGAQIGSVFRADMYVPMKLVTAMKKLIEDMTKAEMEDFDEDEDDELEEDEPSVADTEDDDADDADEEDDED